MVISLKRVMPIIRPHSPSEMAWLRNKKNTHPHHLMNEITVPKKLEPIIQAFFAESPQVAKKLIIQAAKAIYGTDDDKDAFERHTTRQHKITDEEIEDICALMHGIKPIDTLEAILAAQIVISHMLGMRKMAKGYIKDTQLGLKMFQFSSDAIGRLLKKRSGGMQNVTVNYNYNNRKSAPIPTIPVEVRDGVIPMSCRNAN